MKQKKFNKKLSLNKKTIANLSNGEKGNVVGGHDSKTCFIESICMCPLPTRLPTCPETCDTCPSACSAAGNCC